FVISRMVPAPAERVWRAWTNPDELASWFGPKGYETIHAKLDFRVGGTYHYGMAGGGMTVWGKWVFQEIEPPARFRVLMSFSDEQGGIGRHPLSPNWPLNKRATVDMQDYARHS